MDKRINSVGARPARQAAAGLGALTQGALAAIGDVPVGIHVRATVPSVSVETREAAPRDPGLLVQRCRT